MRSPSVEPIASCSGPTTWAATKTTASATSGAVERLAVGDGRDQPPRRHGDRRRQRPAHDQPDPPRHGVAGRGAAEGAEERPLLAPAEPVDHPRPRRRTGRAVVPMPPSSTRGARRSCTNGRPPDAIVELIVPDAAVPTPPRPTTRVAIVTGANHGIGAATAVALAAAGRRRAAHVPARSTSRRTTPARRTPTTASGRRRPTTCWRPSNRCRVAAVAVEADLPTTASPADLFDDGRAPARARCRSSSTTPAAGSPTRSRPTPTDRLGRRLGPVTPATIDRNLGVDARAGALLIAELARRHVARGRDVGSHRRSHLGRADGLPERGLLRRGQGGAGELHDVGGRPSWPPSASRPTSCTRRSPTPAGSPTRCGRSSPPHRSTTTSPARPRWPRSSPGCAPTPPGWSPGARCGCADGPALIGQAGDARPRRPRPPRGTAPPRAGRRGDLAPGRPGPRRAAARRARLRPAPARPRGGRAALRRAARRRRSRRQPASDRSSSSTSATSRSTSSAASPTGGRRSSVAPSAGPTGWSASSARGSTSRRPCTSPLGTGALVLQRLGRGWVRLTTPDGRRDVGRHPLVDEAARRRTSPSASRRCSPAPIPTVLANLARVRHPLARRRARRRDARVAPRRRSRASSTTSGSPPPSTSPRST